MSSKGKTKTIQKQPVKTRAIGTLKSADTTTFEILIYLFFFMKLALYAAWCVLLSALSSYFSAQSSTGDLQPRAVLSELIVQPPWMIHSSP